MSALNHSRPKKYKVYAAVCIILGIVYIANIFITVWLTGAKEMRDFAGRDWFYFAAFAVVEAIILLFVIKFAGKLRMICNEQLSVELAKYSYAGIEQGEYDFVWIDFTAYRRAKIKKSESSYLLYVEEFDEKTCTWSAENTVSIFASLSEIKDALFYEFDFYCDANATLDKHGNEQYKDSCE